MFGCCFTLICMTEPSRTGMSRTQKDSSCSCYAVSNPSPSHSVSGLRTARGPPRWSDATPGGSGHHRPDAQGDPEERCSVATRGRWSGVNPGFGRFSSFVVFFSRLFPCVLAWSMSDQMKGFWRHLAVCLGVRRSLWRVSVGAERRGLTQRGGKGRRKEFTPWFGVGSSLHLAQPLLLLLGRRRSTMEKLKGWRYALTLSVFAVCAWVAELANATGRRGKHRVDRRFCFGDGHALIWVYVGYIEISFSNWWISYIRLLAGCATQLPSLASLNHYSGTKKHVDHFRGGRDPLNPTSGGVLDDPTTPSTSSP